MAQYDFVIYHKGCIDGFASFIALVISDRISNNAIIYPDVPSAMSEPSGVAGKNVIIMDVAYNKRILEKIFDKADRVTFIDHHDSIREDVKELMNNTNNSKHEIIYDDSKSGASLTWSYLFTESDRIPLFIRMIADNDIGAWKMKYTLPFITALRVKYNMQQTPENINKWRGLLNKKEVKYLIKKGLVYNEYMDMLLNENSKRYSIERFPSEEIFNQYPGQFSKIGQYKVAVSNTTCPSASLLGARFAQSVDCDFAIIWSQNLESNLFILQFRSKSVDVGKIAKILGGGGHVLASSAALSSNKYNMRSIFMPNSLPRDSKH